MALCLIGLGANLGDRLATLERAVAALHDPPTMVLTARSRWYESAPVGGPQDQAEYLNGAAVVATSLLPDQVLLRLGEIEHQLGRRRDVRWGARTIDLDLLLVDERIVETPSLVVPHPRLAFRRFALAPAVEVAASWVHPSSGWSLKRLLAHAEQAWPHVVITSPRAAVARKFARTVAEQVQAVSISAPARPIAPHDAALDPAGLTTAEVIKSLDDCGRLLARDAWPAAETVVVSDFWIEAWLAWGETMLPSAELIESHWRQLRERLVPPKLLVVEKCPAAPGAKTNDVQRTFWKALEARSQQPDLGPVLRLSMDEPDATAEVAAAIFGLQSPVTVV